MADLNAQMFRAPFLIQGKKRISEVFGVKPATVRDWILQGAPVFLAGNMWQADYYNLVAWLEAVKPARNAIKLEDD